MPARRRLHPAWIVAAAAFAVMITAAGFRAVPGALMPAMQDDLGWSTALLGGAVAVNLVLYALGAPFAAAFVERFGMRRVCTIALLIVGFAILASSQMTTAWQMYLLWGVVIGACTGAVAVPLAAIVANRWFARRRGLVTGLLSASNASGAVIFVPIVAVIVAASSWETALLAFAAFGLLVVTPVAAFALRDRPSDLGVYPYGTDPADPPPPQPKPSGNPVRFALSALRGAARERDFWFLAGAFFICGATTNGLIATHLISACTDHGLTTIQGGWMLAAIGLFDIVGTLASGWLTDRYDPRILLFAFYGLRGLALVGLDAALADAGLLLVAVVIFYGLDWVATVPPTVALCRDCFGLERASVIFAWVFASHQLGAAAAAFGAGASRTYLDSYAPAFIVAGGLAVLAAWMSLRVGRARMEQRMAALDAA